MAASLSVRAQLLSGKTATATGWQWGSNSKPQPRSRHEIISGTSNSSLSFNIRCTVYESSPLQIIESAQVAVARSMMSNIIDLIKLHHRSDQTVLSQLLLVLSSGSQVLRVNHLSSAWHNRQAKLSHGKAPTSRQVRVLKGHCICCCSCLLASVAETPDAHSLLRH